MPCNISLTPQRCLTVFGCILFTCYWVVSSFMLDLANNQTDSNKKMDIASVERDHGPFPDDRLNHLHWFVQISDLHLSAFSDSGRTEDLLKFCQENLDIIRPEVVMLSGDITDAKLANNEGSHQSVDEWKQYDSVLNRSAILSKTVWLDTRGNHDAFNVPSLSSSENYYSFIMVVGCVRIYSPAGRIHPLSYQYVHKTSDGDKFSFVALDSCRDPGPKRPFNFFGSVSPAEFDRVQAFVDRESNVNQTIFFGHYPTSTITSPHPGIRQLLGRGIVYLCGHLHTFGGLIPKMYAMQQTGYLELELGDWRSNRLYRLLAVDHDLVSFTDIDHQQWPVVLVTNPKNSEFFVPKHEPLHRIKQSTHIRILAFSNAPITSVLVSIDDIHLGEAQRSGGPLYVLPWNPNSFSAGSHTIRVLVKDSAGGVATVKQSFSVDYSQQKFSFWRRFILMSDLTSVLQTLFALSWTAVVLPLVVVKLARIRIQMVVETSVMTCCLRLLQGWLRRYYLIASSPRIFYPLVGYNVYLLIGPWFIGEILDGYVGACFLYGIFVHNAWLACPLTYLYGTFQVFLFSGLLTLYLGRCLDLVVCANKDRNNCCRSRLGPVLGQVARWFADHILFLLIVGLQLYLVISGFYKSYGAMALFLCPLRTWAVVLALYLRHEALREPEASTCISVERCLVRPVHGPTSSPMHTPVHSPSQSLTRLQDTES